MSLAAQLARAPNATERRRIIGIEGQPATAELVYQLCDEARNRMRVDMAEAWGYAAAACAVARVVRDGRAKAEALRIKGHLSYLRGLHREAARSYEKAIIILEAMGAQLDVGRTLSSALQTLMYLGRYDQALEWAQRARSIFEAEGDDLRLARLESNVANILGRQEQFKQAVPLYQSALEQLERLGDGESAAITLRNMAVSYMGMHEFAKALEANQRALAYYRSNGLILLEAEVNDNIAYLHSLRGNYTRAIALYQQADLATRGSSYHLAVSKLDQSDLYLDLNLFTEAAQLAQEAAERFRKLGMRLDRAKSLVNLGAALVRSNDIGAGLRLFRQARGLFAREQNPFSAAVTDLYRAAAWLELGQHMRALDIASAADEVLSSSSLTGKAVTAAVLVGRICLAAGDMAGAEAASAAALERLRRADTAPLRYQVHALAGEVQECRGDLSGAVAAFSAANNVIESLRGRLQHDGLKVAFLDDKLHVYEHLVPLLLRLEVDLATTLGFVERAKSWSLADALAQLAKPASEPHLAGGDVAASLRQTLSWLYRRLDRAESTAGVEQSRITQIQNDIAARESELLTVITTSHRAAPDDAPWGAPEFRPEMVQALLPDDAAVLEYFEARGLLHLFVITRRQLRHIELGRVEEIRRVRRLLRLQMAKGQQDSRSCRSGEYWMETTLSHLRRLHEHLIGPAEAWLPRGHWVIVPHGDLHGLPFHGLHDGDRYVIDRHTISYAPSASILHLCSVRAPSGGHGALIMGVPDRRAPFIGEECEAIAEIIPQRRLVLGKEATSERLRLEASGSRFIHLATHGVFRSDNPLFSSLRLGDSRFCVIDFCELRLDAELATLSGCSTGVHEVVGADEILGLTRGLLLAGARAVQVSLWEVNDRSTAEYMRCFYGNLMAGSGPCDAMREAMFQLRERYPHPYFWAPFAYVGKFPEPPIFPESSANP